MFAEIKIKIEIPFILEKLKALSSDYEAEVVEAWHDDQDIVIHLKYNGKKIKFKLRPHSYRDTYVAFMIRGVVVDGWLKIPDWATDRIIFLLRGFIERPLPLADIKVEDGVLYLSNVLSNDFRIEGSCLCGQLFLDHNLG